MTAHFNMKDESKQSEPATRLKGGCPVRYSRGVPIPATYAYSSAVAAVAAAAAATAVVVEGGCHNKLDGVFLI
jgi:hypothetical protein